MNDHRSSNSKSIKHIVRLKQLIRKWHNVTINSKLANKDQRQHQHKHKHQQSQNDPIIGISPSILNRLRSETLASDSDDEGSQTPYSPSGIPRGYLAVYVGLENRRFVIPTTYLTHKLFKTLLEKVEEEFGFDHDGGLTIPCEIETFKYLLKCIENENENLKEGICLGSGIENGNLKEGMSIEGKGKLREGGCCGIGSGNEELIGICGDENLREEKFLSVENGNGNIEERKVLK